MGPSGVSSSLPTGSPRKGAYPGEHRGRPRRRDGKQQANPGERAGTEPRPYRSSSGPMQASAPTEEREIRRRFAPRNSSSPSPARSEAPAPVPGKVQEGAEAPSWFPPPAERIGIIFRHGMYVTKNTSHEATCGRGPPLSGRSSSAPKRSGKSSSQRPQRGAGSGSPRPNVPRYIWAKSFISPPPGTPRPMR